MGHTVYRSVTSGKTGYVPHEQQLTREMPVAVRRPQMGGGGGGDGSAHTRSRRRRFSLGSIGENVSHFGIMQTGTIFQFHCTSICIFYSSFGKFPCQHSTNECDKDFRSHLVLRCLHRWWSLPRSWGYPLSSSSPPCLTATTSMIWGLILKNLLWGIINNSPFWSLGLLWSICLR